MSTSIAELLQAFEKLSAKEREDFIQEVLKLVRRSGSSVELRNRGIDQSRAADLRTRLKAFAEDWDRPEAAITIKPAPGRSAVRIAGFFNGHAANFDAGEVSGAEAGLFGEEDMVVAEIERLDAFGDARIIITHNGGADGVG